MASVTLWLEVLKAGRTDEATRHLWEAYFGRLVGKAQARLGAKRGLSGGAEDVALSAFDSFVRAAQAGQFPRLDSRDDLWQVLLMLTARKAGKLLRREQTQRRGGGRVASLEDLQGERDSAKAAELQGNDPDPAEAVAMAEACEDLLEALGDATLREVAVRKLEGYDNAEIAVLLGRSVGTVERKLKVIRSIWSQALKE